MSFLVHYLGHVRIWLLLVKMKGQLLSKTMIMAS